MTAATPATLTTWGAIDALDCWAARAAELTDADLGGRVIELRRIESTLSAQRLHCYGIQPVGTAYERYIDAQHVMDIQQRIERARSARHLMQRVLRLRAVADGQ